jgi:polyferredoxin
VNIRTSPEIYRPNPRFNVLTWPIIGRFLRWRWGRLTLQTFTLLIAALVIYDGLTGPQRAADNLATVTVWLHYRGVLVLGLLVFGNLLCMSCPFTLPRTLARRISGRGRRWPQALRNKWLAIGVLVVYFFLYEWLDLWASPWWTAWIVVGYFGMAFLLEALFAESPFCKYVCPLGTFNFVSSTVSPTQITVIQPDVCRTCVGKECINGSAQVLGCGTELFAPQMTSNLDCTLCLDCVRACPHDNVALPYRSPVHEISQPGSWPRRWDVSLLVWVFAFTGLSNAFGMVPPVFELQLWLANVLNTNSEFLVLLLVFGFLNVLLPVSLALLVAWSSRVLVKWDESLRVSLARFTPALVPVAFAVWLAHYGFHFASGALSIVPVTQNFLLDHGVTLLGEPDWTMAAIMPMGWLRPLEIVITLIGFGVSLYVVGEIGRKIRPKPYPLIGQLPWVLILLLIAAAGIVLFNLPMEMRGTVFFN